MKAIIVLEYNGEPLIITGKIDQLTRLTGVYLASDDAPDLHDILGRYNESPVTVDRDPEAFLTWLNEQDLYAPVGVPSLVTQVLYSLLGPLSENIQRAWQYAAANADKDRPVESPDSEG